MQPQEIKIEKTDFTPYIELKPGFIKIEGRAVLEDSLKFFEPVLNWLNEYIKNPKEKTEVYLILDLCDSSLIRRLVEIFELLLKIDKTKSEVVIYWIYGEEDQALLQKGYEFSKAFNLEFIFIDKKSYYEGKH